MGEKTKIIRIIISTWLAGAILFGPSLALADQYDDQIAALRRGVDAQNQQINTLKAQQNTLANKLAIVSAQISSTNSQLRLNQARFEKVSLDLATARENLAAKKHLLRENLKVLYLENQISPIEALASSSNLGDFFEKKQYLEKVKVKVEDSVGVISALGQQLESQQRQLNDLITQQKSLQFGLSQQRNSSASLLAETKGEESRYQAKVASDKQQITKLQAQQAAEIAARSRTVSSGGTGGYPWANSPKDGGSDPWGFYWRECTSYAAWRRSDLGHPIPAWGRMGYADAKTWVDWARGSGLAVDRQPSAGAIGVYTGGTFGHVMVVEAVSGSQVLVSQYNADFTGHYSQSYWDAASLWFIH